MIELSAPIKHKLANLGVLSQKNRKPDENPGAQLSLEATLALDVAEHVFPGIRDRLFEAVPKAQGQLEGMSLDQVREFAAQCGWIVWQKEHTGHKLTIDFGIGGASNPVIADCKLHHFKFRPEEGSVFCSYKVDSSDVSEAMFGKLAKLKSCEIMLTIEPPKVDEKQADIEDDTAPAAKPRKPAAAERAAVAKVKGGKAPPVQAVKYRDPKTGETWSGRGLQPKWLKVAIERGAKLTDFEGEQSHAKLSSEPAWPFPIGARVNAEKPPQSVTIERSQPGTRTARGREATKAFLAANGAAKS